MGKDPEWVPHGVHDNLRPYMFALGVLQRNWLNVERAMEFLLWHYLKAEREAGEAITTHIGNQTRAHILLSLAELKERSPEALEALRHAVDCYSTLLLNRNLVVHNQMGGADETAMTTFRVLSRGSVIREILPLSLSRIQSTADRIWDFTLYLYEIRNHLQLDETLPEKFPKPRSLLTLIREDRDRKTS